jgi:hypothetical protein
VKRLLDLFESRVGVSIAIEPKKRLWDCDSDSVVAAMSIELSEERREDRSGRISEAILAGDIGGDLDSCRLR